jgi:hypothetical protein
MSYFTLKLCFELESFGQLIHFLGFTPVQFRIVDVFTGVDGSANCQQQ